MTDPSALAGFRAWWDITSTPESLVTVCDRCDDWKVIIPRQDMEDDPRGPMEALVASAREHAQTVHEGRDD